MNERRQRFYARLAGFLFFWLIITGLAGAITESRITGSGPFADRAARTIASERLYRIALCCELVETTSALLLGFALYATLRPVDPALALMGLCWRMGESIVGAAGVALGFVKLRVLTSQQSEPLFKSLEALPTANIAAIFFGFGSLVFFYLFWKSGYIPKSLSVLGIVASLFVPVICFGGLIFPEYNSQLMYGWAPMAVAEVATGIWLLVFAVNTKAFRGTQTPERATSIQAAV